jgi:hypothetical protein
MEQNPYESPQEQAVGDVDTVNPADLRGRKIAAILFFLDSADSGCCTGIVEHDGDDYSIKGSDFRLPLTLEMLGRVRRINDPNLKLFDGAEFFVPVSVGRLPEGVNPDEHVKTGLQWKPNVPQD